MPRLSLHAFVTQVHNDCRAALGGERFCSAQRSLLEVTIDRLFRAADPGDWGQPLGLFYAIYRICGDHEDDVALALGRFAAFYIASADLFDDVQDEDLAGKPHEQAGPAIATNSALTLLTLALDAVGQASVLERRDDRKLRYLRLFNRVSLIAVAAQHQDLMGAEGAQTRAEVEHMHRGKTSSIALVCECAALAGGADQTTSERFYQLGEELAAAVQVIDDIRDLVAKDQSVDLLTGKSTYPLACFHETADPAHKAQLTALLAQDPVDLNAVRELLEIAGAFNECAAAVEQHRQRILDILDPSSSVEGAALGPHERLILEIVEHLVAALYDPPRRPSSRPPACGTFSVSVERASREFFSDMKSWGFSHLPLFIPWHLPTFLYVPDQGVVYFSDVDHLPEEVLPFHCQLQQLSKPETKAVIEQSAPFLVAHELTHAWRDALGLLGSNAWHEEFIANQVAFAYVLDKSPEVAEAIVSSARRLLARDVDEENSIQRRALVAGAMRPSQKVADYDCSPQEAALIHAEMLVQIAQLPQSLPALITRWLECSDPVAAE